MRCLIPLFLMLVALVCDLQPQLVWAVEVPENGVAWVWDRPQGEDSSNDPRYFRVSLELTAKPAAAELFVTVDNVYTVFVNGQKLGGDAEWQTIDKHDVSQRLVVGKNVIAIEARNQGGAAGLIAWLQIVGTDKETAVFGSGENWRVSLAAPEKWTTAAFDDSSWPKVAVLGGPGSGPWNIGGAASSKGSGGDVNVSDKSITTYRPADEELKAFELPEGFEIELIAAEPLVINPVCVTLDDRGRMYVSESHTYRFGPSGSPVKTPTNPIVRLDPKPAGGYTRVVVAEGFDDPVMGMSIRNGQLWCTANNYLYRYDLTDEGPAKNKQTLLIDKNKAWNPFGMFVIEWGPDGLLYLSVGNHQIDIEGPDGKVTGRGGSGIVCRLNADGTKLERLVHGLRVPYSFEFDPFGQLWLLSNGEGNPNRFVRVIEGVDYHCYSRSAANNEWLAGRHPLAPPCFELPRGANTQLVRYYGSAYPESYRGNLFLDNWGAHGFGGPNRTIFRYVSDERGQIIEKHPWLVCRDPHFRCSHLFLDHEGNLLIADWYGRDDESDLTGRIWRVRYKGTSSDKPPLVTSAADSFAGLGSPNHRVREQAIDELVKRGAAAVEPLSQTAASSPEPLQAAGALWALARIDAPEKWTAIVAGSKNVDWRVRRLAMSILRHRVPAEQQPLVQQTAAILAKDADPAVRLEAAISLRDVAQARAALLGTLRAGAASDPFLRYEAAWHLARHADAAALAQLLSAEDENIRLAGLIAIDVACYENLLTKPSALEALAKLIANPGQTDWDLVLTLVNMNNDASLAPALETLLTREDVSAEVTARAIMTMRSQGGLGAKQIGAAATRRFLTAVESGRVRPSTAGDHLMLLELLASEAPTPFALREISQRLSDGNVEVRAAAHALARKFGKPAASLASQLWNRLLDKQKQKPEDRIQAAVTLQFIEEKPRLEGWQTVLLEADPTVVRDVVRSWRAFGQNAALKSVLVAAAPEVLKRDSTLAEDLEVVLAALGSSASLEGIQLPNPPVKPFDEAGLRTHLLSSQQLTSATGEHSALLGRRVFERAQCVSCHTTINSNALRAPSLQGIGKAQKPEYLVESLFEPSKVIKTGFETELILTSDGQSLSGLVKEEGSNLRVITVDKERMIAKADVEQRAVQKKSLMPEGLFKGLTPGELRDLLAYLQSLK